MENAGKWNFTDDEQRCAAIEAEADAEARKEEAKRVEPISLWPLMWAVFFICFTVIALYGPEHVR